MGYGAPNSVRLIIDTDNTDRCSRTSGRAASFRICTKAINSAVQSYEYTRLTVSTYLLPMLYFLRAFSYGFSVACFTEAQTRTS